jgi:competence protein ComEA
MKQGLANLFIFTKSERIGILALIALILLILLGRSVIFDLSAKQEYDYFEVQNQLAILKATQDTLEENYWEKKKWPNKKYSNSKDKSKSSEYKKQALNRRIIDPNIAGLEDWKQLGFSQKQAQAILNYRSKGVVFKKKKDLLKLFVVDDDKLAEIERHIKIENISKDKIKETQVSPEEDRIVYKKKSILVRESININTADTAQLKHVYGIGSYYAKSIIKYREIMGGIANKEQFSEIYGLQDNQESIDSLVKYVWFDSSAIAKININECTYKELAFNRYITYDIARALVNYREMHGPFKNVGEITNSHLVSDELSSKIAPYLKVNDD